ncbi:uncharacterized protein LY89DRAFT_663029 [Mollisia scopiformis]|uniref:Rhodopsin domain-containing protein n=1 Tax=Mollisia scopiformis TaxID=149040 RepID=A0A194XVW1_MOLSC|nr:uncharacterized protein LY89DRAFT_663029 [Mollisia scopiformis]KUJ24276.1 hypothetical protein LY89DRAFT_663029 [Mollisia scopiformis]
MNYICMGVATSYGVGRHAYCLTTNNLVSAAKWNFTADPFGIMAVVVPKLAVVALLNSLVSAFKKKGIYFLWFCVISNIIFSIVAAIVLFAQCDPPSSLWNVAIPHKCWKPRIVADYSMFCGAWSAFNDLILALYPISLFYNLQMALWKRIAVCGLLGLGVFDPDREACSSPKLFRCDLGFIRNSDLGGAGAEANVIIICACVPTLVPLVRQITGRRDYILERTRGTSQRTLKNEVSLRDMNTNTIESGNDSQSKFNGFDPINENRSTNGSSSREDAAGKWHPL